jgi:hypothetical protein
MSHPSPRTIALPPSLTLNIKDSLKEDGRLLDGGGIFMKGGLLFDFPFSKK